VEDFADGVTAVGAQGNAQSNGTLTRPADAAPGKEVEKMKKIILIATVILTIAFVATSFAGDKAKMDLKVGDEIYACNCGEDCPCNTMSRNAGKCTCGKDMVKAKVMKVEGDKVMLKSETWEKERAFKTTGNYMCDCGPDCKCDTISQNPGKCTCGNEMKKVN
jgi:hypothetical protein